MTEPRDFEAFMKAYQDMVFTTAVRLVGNEAEAEDISQEVFLKAYQHYDDLAHSPTVGGWLRTVARNLSLNHLTRYRARWRFFSEIFAGREDEHGPVDLPAPDTSEQAVADADRHELLERALRKLPESQRVPLVLYHFEELSCEEIAAKLEISLSKVKTDMHRGRLALRQKLKRDAEGDVSGVVGQG